MKVSQFRDFAHNQTVYLRDAMNGKMVAKSVKSLEKYKDIEVFQFYTEFELGREKDYSKIVVIGWVHHIEVEYINNLS